MKIKAMSKTLGGRKILSLEAMELEKGKIYAVLGSNGSGKSTFARLLAGVVKPDRGRELVEQGVRVGYLPQKPYVFRMSLLKNLRLSGANPEQAAEQAESFGLSALAGQNAKKLSGGETARTAMARLLMRRYDLLILDEPTAAMDVEAAAAAERELLRYRERTGCCVVLITHSPAQARRLGDEALILDGGELIERGPVSAVLSAPQSPGAKRFLEYCE